MTTALDALRESVQDWPVGANAHSAIPRLDIYRVTQPLTLPPEVYPPFISLILQGEKQLQIGSRLFRYSAGQAFISSVDLPASGKIVGASDAAPYLAVRLTFDLAVIRALLHVSPAVSEPPDGPGFAVEDADATLLDAWLRLVRLIHHPEDIAVMAPLTEREIVYRLLRGPQGALLRQAADTSSYFSSIRSAVSWLKTHYASPVRIEQLAHMTNMSISVFHRRFKASTGFSPLQYQKHLRLYAARNLLFRQPGNVAAVASTVGYDSLTQFTREYSRLFGIPPARDARDHRGVGAFQQVRSL
ncbi:helix-turn-helix domain-containing protein (plasmid) [Pantoea sp. JZ29]|uniref:AraC family transcriptional regulator n=1 Tax=Pantoea sp. JZ29 TaxID=2654192 RepID=UPI002B49B7F3|nr:AraC family transcriptional regulator [Pantoea sp. JZ29]WRH23146.1 helix-turn-helix domain-containing protein [Pantoea sp. JZ29]